MKFNKKKSINIYFQRCGSVNDWDNQQVAFLVLILKFWLGQSGNYFSSKIIVAENVTQFYVAIGLKLVKNQIPSKEKFFKAQVYSQ